MPATNGYPNTVVFPADDEMTVVMQGPFNADSRPPSDMWRGVKRILTTPSYESAHFTQYYDPELAAKALQPYARATIGFVGIYQMSFAMGDYIMKRFTSARFVDASELVDRVKVIKSPEELELVRRAAIMQDGAMRAAFAAIKPARITARRTAFICAPRRRPARRPSSASAMCRTAPSRRVTRSRCWSRIPARAACTPSLAAAACSARCRRR
jgi:Xaa-Pro aminopeptidase